MKNLAKTKTDISIGPFFQDNISPKVKMAIICFYKKRFPVWIEILLLVIEYGQIITQILLQTQKFYNTRDLNSAASLDLISFFLKFMNPGYFLDLNKNPKQYWAIIGVTFCYVIVKFILFIYAGTCASKSRFETNIFLEIWKWMFKLHCPVTFFIIVTVFSKMIENASQDSGFLAYIQIFGATCIILHESASSLIIILRHNYILPSKDFSASKSSIMEGVLLLHKSLLLVLEYILPRNSLLSLWFITIISLAYVILSNYFFLTTLPNYNLKCLILKQYLLVLITSLNLAFSLRTFIISITDNKFGIDSALLIWLLLIPLLLKTFSARLKNVFLDLLTKPSTSCSLNLLIQKLILVQNIIITKRSFDTENLKIDWTYLMHRSINLKLENIFDLPKGAALVKDLSIQTKEKAKKVFLMYLERILTQFPKSDFLRLYVAYYYGKKLKMYGIAIRILTRLEKKSSYKIGTSASLLKREIQKLMMEEHSKQNNSIDLVTYMKNIIRIAKLKEKMLKQAELQLNLCKEYKKDLPDLLKILINAQVNNTHRESVEKNLESTLEIVPEYCLEPYIIAQHYYSSVHYSIFDYIKVRKATAKKYQKYEKKFLSPCLERENMYDLNSIFLILSGQKEHAGSIVYCSSSIEDIFGWNPKLLIGNNIISLLPSCVHAFFNTKIRSLIEEGKGGRGEDIIRSFLLQKDGFINQVDLCFNIHPYMQNGFYLDVLARPVQSSADYLILSEDGTIHGFTKRIAIKLGLLTKQQDDSAEDIKVIQICEELHNANMAFNMLRHSGMGGDIKHDRMSITSRGSETFGSPGLYQIEIKNAPNRANSPGGFFRRQKLVFKENTLLDSMKLYETYSTEGKIIDLTPIQKHKNSKLNQTHPYRCKIENRFYGQSMMKLCTLIETDSNEKALSEPTKKDDKIMLKRYSHFLEFNEEGEKDSSSSESSEDSSGQVESFETEDEKENGWVDFQSLSANKILPENGQDVGQSSSRNDVELIKINPIQDHLPSTKRGLLLEPTIANFSPQGVTPERVRRITIIKHQHEKKKQQKKEIENLIEVQRSIGSQKSNLSIRGRIIKACQNALETKYYPRHIDLLLAGLALVLIALISSRIILNSVVENRLISLGGRKTVLRNAEQRNFMLIRTQELVRTLWDAGTINGTGIFEDVESADLGDSGDSVTIDDELSGSTENTLQLSSDIANEIISLTKANQELLFATSLLSEEDRARLFKTDVRVFETYFNEPEQKYINVTNFQATELVIENLYKGLSIALYDVPSAVPQFKFIVRNSLNDFLITSEATVGIFLDALTPLEDQDKAYQQLTLILSILFIMVGCVIFVVIIREKYYQEKENMLSFARIDIVQVDKVLKDLITFKKVISEELYFERKDKLKWAGIFDRYLKSQEDSHTKAKKYAREANYNGIFKKYFIFALQLAIISLVAIVLFGLNYFLTTAKIHTTYTTLRQLHYSNWLRGRVYLSYTILSELLSSNDTVLIRNEATSIQLIKSIEDVKDIRTEITSGIFKNSNSEYDATIEALLFRDACSYLIDTEAQDCLDFQTEANKLSFVSLLSDVEYFTNIIRLSYVQSTTKRITFIRRLDAQAAIRINPRIQILTNLNQLLSFRLDELFDNAIEDTKYSLNLQNWLIVGILPLVSFVIWITVLKKARESDNIFKNVLKNFPADVVLSNFILKEYLKRTSKDAFNSVLNEI